MVAKHCKKNIWIVKPINANRGEGIEIFKGLEELIDFINASGKGRTWIVQKYIERPLLFHGRKFDIRVWAVMTDKNEVYYYK